MEGQREEICGYCKVCGRPMTIILPDGLGFCEGHRWVGPQCLPKGHDLTVVALSLV